MTKDRLINQFPFFYQTPSRLFHQQTNQDNFREETKSAVIPRDYTKVNYKGYPRFEMFPLPKPQLNLNFNQAMMNRQSRRTYNLQDPISPEQLSTILYYTAGLKKPNNPDVGNRFYPSAGARYPLEIYPIIFNCESTPQGIYHYHLKNHSLEFLWTFPDLSTRVFTNIKQPCFKTSNVVFVITAVSSRTERKYGARGYRHTLMEVGHMCQNLYLATTVTGLHCCSIGGYLDAGFDSLLDIDGILEKTMLVIAAGNPERR